MDVVFVEFVVPAEFRSVMAGMSKTRGTKQRHKDRQERVLLDGDDEEFVAAI